MAIKLNIEYHAENSRQAKVNDTVPVKRLLDAVVTTFAKSVPDLSVGMLVILLIVYAVLVWVYFFGG